MSAPSSIYGNLVNGFAVKSRDEFYKISFDYFLNENNAVEYYAKLKDSKFVNSVEMHKNVKVTPSSCKDYAK